jgi:Protein of unknown function (DUF938)
MDPLKLEVVAPNPTCKDTSIFAHLIFFPCTCILMMLFFIHFLRIFDNSLRQRDALWGLRDLELVIKEAEANGLTFLETIEMPANNLVVLFRKIDV